MSMAFRKAGVSRNAVAATAPIAELFIAERQVLEQLPFCRKLSDLVKLCTEKIIGEIEEKVVEMKRKRELLPFQLK